MKGFEPVFPEVARRTRRQRPSKNYVERVQLGVDLEHREALASVRLGEVLIHGVAVWRSRSGHLSVHFPSYRTAWGWAEAIVLAPELRADIEASVIAAYRRARKARRVEAPGLPVMRARRSKQKGWPTTAPARAESEPEVSQGEVPRVAENNETKGPRGK